MKIGELSKHTGCEVETIRYYEREHLLPTPPRSDGNYRQYSEADAERLQFIRHCRSLGMSLDDVRTLQRFQANPEMACDQIDAMLDRHLLQTEAQIETLQKLQKQLQTLRNACRDHLDARQCGILQNLERAASRSDCVCHAEHSAMEK
ncbi:MAG TPA: Cd(II)/Pb(II)-responsive transcriptional regulator [Noviherbaspirillum sp.]|jgi:Cd(II)/Pb(II)-responsive transcriptional regulator|uniref:Cd(II)/Pb(II)-responsive transcriptional regulator n=1 Tax=Noviherbaspirillum sp. TaxID=1926288 RepID=UPI002DDCF538|nr:Cd(II)/Pb(II)-responsive transcriptional regulator [Noviherbaspirillum sp.]HEV2612810.1 Cd(II)/Pb(II)-responsive transcriptional regulator [Noviherbaspirillum sp.]